MKPQLLAMMILASSAVQQATATIIFKDVENDGHAVTSVDRAANFNLVNNGSPLSNYEENFLSITTDGLANLSEDPFNKKGTDEHFFCAGVNYSWVTIRTMDGIKITGIEFLYGNAWTVDSYLGESHVGLDSAVIEWQAYNNGMMVSSGVAGPTIAVGTVIGFKSLGGFDYLQVRSPLEANGDGQAIALDNLKVQLAPIPEPSTWIAGIALTLPFGVQVLRHVRNRKWIS